MERTRDRGVANEEAIPAKLGVARKKKEEKKKKHDLNITSL
jgi:hypothetical protein